MQAGNTNRLRGSVGAGFTLPHITGYMQSRDEWLVQMRQGQFVYCQGEVQDLRVTVVDDASAHPVVRALTDARVYGSRHEWRLQRVLDYALRTDCLLAERAVATLWN